MVTVEEAHALGLVCCRESVAILHLGLTSLTALGLDLNHTVSTLGTPDGCSGSVLEYGDALYILRVDVEQFGELVFGSAGVVEPVLIVAFEDVPIDHDEWFGVSVDGAHTA